ncbi:MAG: arylesterase [Bdellovibrionales bacterium]
MRFFIAILLATLPINVWADPKAEIKTIVIVGDSLTEGYGVSKENAYPALLEKKIAERGYKVVNAGISGSTSASAPARVKWQLKSKPEILVLALGANDGLRGLSVENMQKNLRAAVNLALDAKVKVVLVGMRMPPNYGKEYSEKFRKAFDRLSKELRVTYIPFLLKDVGGNPKLNLTDGIHPNEAGHKILAETVFQGIRGIL